MAKMYTFSERLYRNNRRTKKKSFGTVFANSKTEARRIITASNRRWKKAFFKKGTYYKIENIKQR